MGKEHYIEQLKEQLHEIMERPVTLGRAEEVTVYADAICALRRMDGPRRGRGLYRGRRKSMDGPHGERGRHDRPALDDGARRTPWPISQVSA